MTLLEVVFCLPPCMHAHFHTEVHLHIHEHACTYAHAHILKENATGWVQLYPLYRGAKIRMKQEVWEITKQETVNALSVPGMKKAQASNKLRKRKSILVSEVRLDSLRCYYIVVLPLPPFSLCPLNYSFVNQKENGHMHNTYWAKVTDLLQRHTTGHIGSPKKLVSARETNAE